MFPYMGSKRKELPQIQQQEPADFKTVVDVFGGGGSIALNYIKREDFKGNVVYNDRIRTLVRIFEIVRDGDEAIKALLAQVDEIEVNDEQFKVYQAKYKEALASNTSDPVTFLYLVNNCMHGNLFSHVTGKKKNDDGTYTQVSKSTASTARTMSENSRIDWSRFTMTNDDYKDLMNKYKSDPDAFIYCDPPYTGKYGNNVSYGVSNHTDYLSWIAEFMQDKDTKCKVMLNLEFNGDTYHKLKPMIKMTYQVNYATRKVFRSTYHIIACNYDPPERKTTIWDTIAEMEKREKAKQKEKTKCPYCSNEYVKLDVHLKRMQGKKGHP